MEQQHAILLRDCTAVLVVRTQLHQLSRSHCSESSPGLQRIAFGDKEEMCPETSICAQDQLRAFMNDNLHAAGVGDYSFGQIMSLSLTDEFFDARGVVVRKQRREHQCDNGPKVLALGEQHDRRVRLSLTLTFSPACFCCCALCNCAPAETEKTDAN